MSTEASKQRTDPAFLSLILLAAAVRLAYWLSKWNQELLFNDSLYYSAQARQLADGHFFRELFVDQPGAQHGPLTPTLMAPLSWGTDPVRWQRLVTVGCGVALVCLIGLLATRLGGRRVGLAAVAIAAVYPNLWLSDGLVMSESVGMLAVAAVLWFALNAADRVDRRSAIALGVVLGVAALARSEFVLMVPLTLCWLAIGIHRQGRRAIAAVAPVLVTFLLVLSPWVAFNLARFERPVLLTTNEGSTWLGANCEDSYSGEGMGGWNIACLTQANSINPDEDASVRSARQRSLAIDYARDHVGDVPRVMLARLGRTFDVYGVHDVIGADIREERPRLWAWAGVPSFWLLALATPFGARRLARRERWLLLLPLAMVLFTTVVFYGGHRIRSSAEPSLVLLAAIAITPLIEATVRRFRGTP